MKRKKISKPPAKDKETPAKEENSVLVGLMKKHDISYDQALKMAIQMDAEKNIFDVSKINLFLQLNGLDDLSRSHMISGRSGGYTGRHPRDDDQEQHHRRMEELEEKKIKLKEKELKQQEAHHRRLEEIARQKQTQAEEGTQDKNSLVSELCNHITSAMQANVQVQPSKGKSSKPTPLGELRKIYPKWCEGNLEFDPKLPPKKNKQYYRTDILRMWQESKEYGYWLENHDTHGWDDPSESEVTKIFSSTHTKLHINIHSGNTPLHFKKH